MTVAAREDYRTFSPVEENIERPETLRQSLMARHDLCPHSAYLDRRFSTSSHAMDRGTALHETIERLQRRLMQEMAEGGEVTLPEEVARDEAEAVMAERTDLVIPAVEQDRVRGMAWNWARSPYSSVDPETLLGIEIPMEIEVGGFRCTGRIDRVEAVGQTLYIYDWKSGFPGDKESVEKSWQGQFYGMLLLWGFQQETDPRLEFGAGINDVWFYEVFPRERDEDTNALFVHEAVWSRTELYEFKTSLERNIGAFEESLRTGIWPASNGPTQCSRCPAPAKCPIPADLRQVEEIDTEDDAVDALIQKDALTREGTRIQNGLRGWVEENGAIYHGDTVFDGKPSQSRTVDWKGFDAAPEGADIKDFTTYRKGSKFAARKITKNEKELLNAR